eukprot:364837-Chlamydomonas_euryale.AAC.23
MHLYLRVGCLLGDRVCSTHARTSPGSPERTYPFPSHPCARVQARRHALTRACTRAGTRARRHARTRACTRARTCAVMQAHLAQVAREAALVLHERRVGLTLLGGRPLGTLDLRNAAARQSKDAHEPKTAAVSPTEMDQDAPCLLPPSSQDAPCRLPRPYLSPPSLALSLPLSLALSLPPSPPSPPHFSPIFLSRSKPFVDCRMKICKDQRRNDLCEESDAQSAQSSGPPAASPPASHTSASFTSQPVKAPQPAGRLASPPALQLTSPPTSQPARPPATMPTFTYPSQHITYPSNLLLPPQPESPCPASNLPPFPNPPQPPHHQPHTITSTPSRPCTPASASPHGELRSALRRTPTARERTRPASADRADSAAGGNGTSRR